MMRLEIVDLSEENLRDAPEWGAYPFGCKYCLYWECPSEPQSPTALDREGRLWKKTEWVRTTSEAFGPCGKLVYAGGKAVAYAQFAPARLLPTCKEYPSGPPGDDAVLLACLFIPEKERREAGIGSFLLQAILDDLRQRGAAAVETFARRSSSENPSGSAQFYLKHGFTLAKDDEDFPLMRLDLRKVAVR